MKSFDGQGAGAARRTNIIGGTDGRILMIGARRPRRRDAADPMLFDTLGGARA